MVKRDLVTKNSRLIKRTMAAKLLKLAKTFRAVAIYGPRQSGKTTLVRTLFPDYHYFLFEDLDTRILAQNDPRGFLNQYKDAPGVIFDEVQHVPELLSYMQGFIDNSQKKGHFIITGSQNWGMSEVVTQTLAGRIAEVILLPLSIAELQEAELLPNKINDALFKGMYPSAYDEDVDPVDWYRSYIRTYVERDVRQIRNIPDLALFQKFMQLCAGRIGQVLNLTALSNDTGVSVPTISQWISVLEASFIVFRLKPFHNNFGKRLIQSPKLYFYDTGLACRLLGIETTEQLFTHFARGALFESFVISDLIKQRENRGLDPNVYYWRDHTDYEVDCIIEKAGSALPLEIKVSETFTPHFFDGFNRWQSFAGGKLEDSILVYTGKQESNTQRGKLVSWKGISDINAS